MTVNWSKVAHLLIIWAFYLGLVGFALNAPGVLLLIGSILYLIF